MFSVSAIEADIIQLLNAVNSRSEPVIITRDDGCNGVLISEAEWQAIQETIYLNSIPGLAESIIKGGETPIAACVPEEDVEW